MTPVYKKILCPLDGSEVSRRGAAEAVTLAREQGAQLYFLHVVDNGGTLMHLPVSEEILEFGRTSGRNILAQAATVAGASGVPAHCELMEILNGRVAGAILEAARQLNVDLIVMGSRGQHATGNMLGSDAAAVIADAPVPVLLVK